MKKLIYILLFVSGMAEAQIINFPDANFKATLLSANATNTIAAGSSGYTTIDSNGDGEIQVSEALRIITLQFQPKSITDFSGIENFANLRTLASYSNMVNDFHLDGLQQLTSINVTGNSSSNTVHSFSNLPRLEFLTFSNNSSITSLTLTNLTALKNIFTHNNANLSILNFIGLTALERVNSNYCGIANLSITDSPFLEELNLNFNKLTSISTANLPRLKKLNLNSNRLTSTAGITNVNNIEVITIQGNQISNLILPASLPLLKQLSCGSNGFSTINLLGYPKLQILSMNNNNITNVDFSNNPLLEQLLVANNQLSNLNVSNLSFLKSIYSSGNNSITELDFSHNPELISLDFYSPNLTYVNLKSGLINNISATYADMPFLQHICIDEGDTFTFRSGTPSPLPEITVSISSYCDFIPGGNYNIITGSMIFDENNNGCDSGDAPQPNIKININDGIQQGSAFTSNSGNYTFHTQAGSFNLAPNVENSAWFNFSPATATLPFVDNNNNTATQNFCISANGVHPDLEIVVAPAIPARPGFEAVYKIVYKNKGNQTLSQNYGIGFFYNQHLASFVSATVAPETQVPGSMSWSYADLKPFESRSFYVTLRINTPTEANPVNIDDVLTFTASIMPTAGDENSGDNLFVYNQTVVGSFDPNDIECLQGDIVPPSEIGKYLHYMIRFENTGNYHAENIVVKDIIDTTKYDISSLQVLGTSHPVDARVKGNIAEFIFKSINLDSGGHGNVLLKLKSKASLTAGDEVSKKVSIFFDYNSPINTNNANTVFQTLSVGEHNLDDSIKMYPNPASGNVNIKASGIINSIEFYDVQGRILMTGLVNDNSIILDLSKFSTGIYYVKIKTDKGHKVEKLIKK